MGRRSSNEIVVIMWRDIPAQINGKVGDERHQGTLHYRGAKIQVVDLPGATELFGLSFAGLPRLLRGVGEWRRTSHPVTGDLVAQVDETAAAIEREFTNERLHTLVANGGWDPASPEHHDEQGHPSP